MAEVDFTQDTNGDFGENGEKSNGNGEAPKVQLAFFLECSKMVPRYNRNFSNRLIKMVMIKTFKT